MSTRVTPNPGRYFPQVPLRVYQALFSSVQVATSSSGYCTGTGKMEQQELSPQHSKTMADPLSVHNGSNSFLTLLFESCVSSCGPFVSFPTYRECVKLV
ncbi:hypothetical protein BDV35DRAFT_145784 [Aspergillus flavus]|uniref:Uncharacterized protein n=1 Tax=Aspergillus flavus TaxID=5059 RepID=A0A5N6GCE5_ASPFL|nr:hypothetical protein BDV35DRAFT_145784 [Aspergillus flavus]